MKPAAAITAIVISLTLCSRGTKAFTPSAASLLQRASFVLQVKANNNDDDDDATVTTTTTTTDAHPTRRSVLVGVMTMSVTSFIGTMSSEPVHATYSAYTHREEDWKEREKKNEITFSSAKQLRGQLADIVPANSEKSRIFCPNGPSAAVSPLMENKCGDRLATPSVFGRTDDALGNSIPGYADGYSFGQAQLAMPDYNESTRRRQR